MLWVRGERGGGTGVTPVHRRARGGGDDRRNQQRHASGGCEPLAGVDLHGTAIHTAPPLSRTSHQVVHLVWDSWIKEVVMAQSDFAYVDSDGNEKLPIHDESHVRNAIARFNQTDFESKAAKERARKKILDAARKFDIDVSDASNVAEPVR
jgi:hypothetical protein